MLHEARWYQTLMIQQAQAYWAVGQRNVLLVLPTGGGKSFVTAKLVSEAGGPAVVIAHRAELVTQLSVALAREGIRHGVIGPASLRRACSTAHLDALGVDRIDPNSRTRVASVDTLVLKKTEYPEVVLWAQDEAHHVLASNKWGAVSRLFPNARGLGVTATPLRADGKGLGRHADGLMDALVVGPGMRDLIEQGFLTDYRPFAPPSDIDLARVGLSASGDYSPPQLREARHKSRITGDVVKHYLRIAPGKLGVTFDVDVESATETAAAYRAAGVPAEIVTGKTPDGLRAAILRRFARGELRQLVNVDLFGEGFDLPALEVVSMARPTASYGLYAQQFGRALRPMEGKAHAIIIDHVGNVLRHGLPDRGRVWSLDRRERRSSKTADDVRPIRVCPNPQCAGVYDRALRQCPYCSFVPPIQGRSTPEMVDGDLTEFAPELLAALRGEISRIDRPPSLRGLPLEAHGNIIRRHEARQVAQASLRSAIAFYGGYSRSLGCSDDETFRRFYLTFGVDVLTAQTLGAPDAAELEARIRQYLTQRNVQELVV